MTFARAAGAGLAMAGAFALGIAVGPTIHATRDAEIVKPVPIMTDAALDTAAVVPVAAPTRPSTPKLMRVPMASAEPVREQVKTILNRGTDVRKASEGFQNAHQFMSVAYAAKNTEIPFMLLVSNAVPAASVADLVAYARKNPGRLAYGTPTSATLVGMETLKRLAGIDILGVPYKSSPQALADLVANQIQVIIADWATGMPHVRSGKVRVLAVTMPRRSSLMPDTPTVDETYKGYEISAWSMIYAPGATPREPVARFADALLAALGTSDTRERLARIGFDVNPVGPDQAGEYARSQMASWARLIRQAGIQPE